MPTSHLLPAAHETAPPAEEAGDLVDVSFRLSRAGVVGSAVHSLLRLGVAVIVPSSPAGPDRGALLRLAVQRAQLAAVRRVIGRVDPYAVESFA